MRFFYYFTVVWLMISNITIACDDEIEEELSNAAICKTMHEKNNKINILYLAYYQLEAPELLGLLKNIQSNIFLENLNISHNKATPECMKGVRELLEVNTSLTHLDISYNGFNPHCMKDLAKGLSNNNSLKSLNISGCCVGDEGGSLIVFYLENNESLSEIYINNSYLLNSSAFILAELIKKKPYFRLVSLNNTSITHHGAQFLASALRGNKKTIISLQRNVIRKQKYIDLLKQEFGDRFLLNSFKSINSKEKTLDLFIKGPEG